ncbi:MAG: hypothetical protein RPU59_13925 [Candidatus Sedimenticola sp. (ex Thyasira tokunagai)]
MGKFKSYRKKNLQSMRPYVPGEDLTGVSVSDEDTPEEGGMIAVNPGNTDDKWYIAKDFFNANYEPAENTPHKKPLAIVGIGSQRFSAVEVVNEIGPGGACHEYFISPAAMPVGSVSGEFGHVKFQHGPIGEHGVNGCHQEDLLAIVIHRLRSFQSGDFPCRENAVALTKIEEALHWLNHRTASRQDRGVEGTSQQ